MGGFAVDELPASQDPESKTVIFIKGGLVFNLTKGKMTSDEIFDKFVRSFHFID